MGGLRRSSIAAAMGVAAILLTACGNGAASTTSKTSLGTVKVQMTGDWNTFLPFQATAGTSLPVIYAVYDRLISYGPNGQLVPYLASSWTATPSSVSFTLKKGPKCPDGTPITPTLVKNSFAVLFANKPLAAQFFGPGPYTMAADDATNAFSITLGTPNSSAIYMGVMAWPGSIVCPAGLANSSALTTTPAGSGPYTVVSAVHASQVVLKKRADWNWGPNGASASTLPDTIIYQIVTDSTTAANLLLTGGLDIAQVSGADVQRLLTNKAYNHQLAYDYANFILGFNELPGRVTADKTVRRALMSVIDAKAWLQAAGNGQGELSPSFEEPGAACYDSSVSKYTPKATIAQAQAVLKGDGYTLGADGKFQKNGDPLTVHLIGSPTYFGRGTEYIASIWEQLGVTVNLSDEAQAAYLNDLHTSNFDVVPFPSHSETPDPSYNPHWFTGPILKAGGSNQILMQDPEVDSETTAALASGGQQSCAHWQKVQALVLQNDDLLPLAVPAPFWFAKKGIAFQGNSLEVMPYTIRSA